MFRLIILFGIISITISSCSSQTAQEYYLMGLEKDSLGDNRAALTNFDKAIELNPQFAEAYCKRGFVKQFLGSVDKNYYLEAMSDFNKAISIKPNYAEAYYKRGVTEYNMGDVSRACSDWNKANELKYPMAIESLNAHCK